ncbi:MAG: HAMP domain-containing protein, partial [Eubacterium sp.]
MKPTVMTMLKKLSLRCRSTLLSALLLTLCCAGLTIMLNFSAFQLVDQIEAAAVIKPATEIPLTQELEATPTVSAEHLNTSKRAFSLQSMLYMLFIIGGGSALTYFIAGKALKPLDDLNEQVKNITVHNLSKKLEIPPTKDEIAELTQSFNTMSSKLNDAFMTQKRFSASAAHELRTPLSVLQTKIDVFKKRNTHTSDEYDALIAVFEKQITRLRRLVINLLDMTNMDRTQEKNTIHLRDLFEDILCELS